MKPQGKIFRIKTGYNPNSSSIGSEITAFLWGSAIFTLFANLLVAIVSSVRKREKARESTLRKKQTPTVDRTGN